MYILKYILIKINIEDLYKIRNILNVYENKSKTKKHIKIRKNLQMIFKHIWHLKFIFRIKEYISLYFYFLLKKLIIFAICFFPFNIF